MRLTLCLLIASLFSASCWAYHYSSSFQAQVTRYPDILTEKSRCVSGKSTAKKTNLLICDPQEILTPDQFNIINRQLIRMQETMNSDRAKCDRKNPRPTIAVALVDALDFGRQDQSDENVINYAAMFSFYLFDSWKLPSNCKSESDKVVIFYSKNDGVLYTYAGDNLREKLPRDQITKIAGAAKPAFGAGVFEGLSYMLRRYQEILTSDREGGIFSKE